MGKILEFIPNLKKVCDKVRTYAKTLSCSYSSVSSVLKSSDACGNPFGVRRKPALRLFAASSVVRFSVACA